MFEQSTPLRLGVPKPGYVKTGCLQFFTQQCSFALFCGLAFALFCAHLLGSVPTTPDPNTSEKVSRYKWEAFRDTNWWRIYYFLPREGHTFAKESR